MIKLKQMLKERFHIIDIIDYIKNNYYDIVKHNKEEFLISVLNPEFLKPRRFFTLFPTKLFFQTHESFFPESTYIIKFDLLFGIDQPNSSIIDINNNFDLDIFKVHESIVKMFRITAFGVYIDGDIKIKDKFYSGKKKIVYLPNENSDLNFRFLNDFNSNQSLEFTVLNNSTKISLIQHIEFIPQDINMFKCHSNNKQFNLSETSNIAQRFLLSDYETITQ
jgi:hypothetical protein